MNNKKIKFVALTVLFVAAGMLFTISGTSTNSNNSLLNITKVSTAIAESSGGGISCRCEWFSGSNNIKDCSANGWGQLCAPDGAIYCWDYRNNCK